MSDAADNRPTGAEAFVRALQAHGVRHIFGLCGDTTLPLYDALFRLDHGIRHILTRDERSAAYMADGYARIAGKVGVCEGPSGGGATYMLPGLAEANESSVPVLGINSDISTTSRGHFALTELDLEALYRPVTKWNRVIDRAADIPETVAEAFRRMTGGRPGAVHLGLPFDVQRAPLDAPAPVVGTPPPPAAPDAGDVARAADVLLAAARPVIVCGGGVLIAGGGAALERIADRLGAPVATSISGRGTIGDAHKLALGVVGSNGGVPETRAVIDAADCILFAGCRAGSVTTERWQHPAPGAARIVHIDIDPRVIGANYDPDAAMVADAGLALKALDAALAERLPQPRPAGWGAASVAAARAAKRAAFAALAASDAAPILPERLVADLQSVLPAGAVVVADAGTPCPYLSAYLEFPEAGRRFISNRAHGALGYAIPAAVGAQIAAPDAPVVSVSGDGSFGFCSGELETIVRLGAPLTMIVISNAVFGWIKAGQKSGYGGRYYSVDFDRTDHAAVARAYGVKSWRVEDPAELRAALAAAIAHDGPALVDVVCQPLQDAHAPVSEWVA